MSTKKSNKTSSKPTTKKPSAAPMTAMTSQMFTAMLESFRASVTNPIDARKALLATVAGSVAAGLVTAPSPSISKSESMAAVAVDIAEEILRKVGIASVESYETPVDSPVVDAAS